MNNKNATTRALGALTAITIAAFIGAAIEACTPGQRQAARTVVDAATVACLIANAALPDSEVARVCGIVDGIDDPIRRLLSVQREQVAAAEARGRFSGAVGCHWEKLNDAGVGDGGKP